MIDFFDERRVRESLDCSSLVGALAAAFAAELATVPDRHHHRLARQGEDAPTLLLMPAWNEAYLGVKVVTVFPGNQARHLPTVMGAYLLMSGRTGAPLAYLDAQELTARRTAATSLLAASRLARPGLVNAAGRRRGSNCQVADRRVSVMVSAATHCRVEPPARRRFEDRTRTAHAGIFRRAE